MKDFSKSDYKYLIASYKTLFWRHIMTALACGSIGGIAITMNYEAASLAAKFIIFISATLVVVYALEAWDDFRNMAQLHQDRAEEHGEDAE